MRRATARNSTDSVANLFDQIESIQSTASSHAMRRESIQKLSAAIEQLPAAYREVIQRFDLEQQSAQEIAEHLQCSQGAVYMRRSRGHDLLRSWFREETT